jgi:hypothetical protein
VLTSSISGRTPGGRRFVHQPGGRGDALGWRLPVEGHGQQKFGIVDAEGDDGRPADRDRAAAHLAEGGGHPDLILLFQGQASGQPATELTCREDAGQVPNVKAGKFAGHDLSTMTPASSR